MTVLITAILNLLSFVTLSTFWLFVEFSSVNFNICGDINIHQKEWLFYSFKPDEEYRYCKEFSIVYNLTQIIECAIRVADAAGHLANLLDLFLTLFPEK